MKHKEKLGEGKADEAAATPGWEIALCETTRAVNSDRIVAIVD
jgi:hypothetical protein